MMLQGRMFRRALASTTAILCQYRHHRPIDTERLCLSKAVEIHGSGALGDEEVDVELSCSVPDAPDSRRRIIFRRAQIACLLEGGMASLVQKYGLQAHGLSM